MKLIYLVIDGGSDGLNGPTSFEVAVTPGLDYLARKGVGGLMYTIGRGIAPESDAAVLSLLGYDPHKYYTGRGPLEALGSGIKIKEGFEVAFRANFATINSETLELIDRRCGRTLKSNEAKELAKSLDNMDLSKYNGYARVTATIGHRAVVIIGSKSLKLSGDVSNTDPAYRKKGVISIAVKDYEKRVAECKPLTDTPEAKRTAELVNIFTRKSIEILDKHPINLKRTAQGLLPANVILLRDSGDKLPQVEPISTKFNKKFGAIVEMPVEKGIVRLLGMDLEEVPPPTTDKAYDYAIRLKKTFELLNRVDVVYVHLKGPDEPGHDGDFRRKVEAIEAIDEHFVQPLLGELDLNNTAILVTSDHSTPWKVKAHTDDPVPVLLYSPNLKPDNLLQFSEKEFTKGSLGIIEHGWLLLPLVFEKIF